MCPTHRELKHLAPALQEGDCLHRATLELEAEFQQPTGGVAAIQVAAILAPGQGTQRLVVLLTNSVPLCLMMRERGGGDKEEDREQGREEREGRGRGEREGRGRGEGGAGESGEGGGGAGREGVQVMVNLLNCISVSLHVYALTL